MNDRDTSTDMPEEAEWHLRLFKRSLLKQSKLKNIKSLLPPVEGKSCIDVGGDNGVISFMLRKEGGAWQSVDLSEKAVRSIGNLVGEDNAHLIDNNELPFEDDSADIIVIIDYLEHVEDDYGFVQECHRVLKPTGIILCNVPNRKKWSFIRPLRLMLGLTDELHGHVRPGYNEQDMYRLLRDGFDIIQARTYNRFFVELVDTGVQFLSSYIKSSREGDASKGNMIDQEDFSKYIKAFRLYSFVYPVLVIASKLDLLLAFCGGHSLVVQARSRAWNPRREVKIRDGRSIAEASLRSKIGTAADLKQR